MSRECKGCGVKLQSEDKTKIGYTPKEGSEYCQRCFRIRHYDDLVISMKQGIDSFEVLQKISKLDALVLWVVDLFDFEANMINGLNRHLAGKDIVMVATKRDLLPDTLSNEKLSNFIFSRLKEYNIHINGFVVCTDLAKHANADDNDSIEGVKEAVEYYRNGRDVVVMGMANAGKSTMLNALCGNKDLTTSRYPGTTLDINSIKMDGYTLYDTPGITRYDSLLTHLDDHLLKQIVPSSQIKARIYQLRENQTLSLGGLVRLDLSGCDHVSCVGYFSNALELHRSKMENANRLWETHLNEMLSPSINKEFKEMQVHEHKGTQSAQEKIDVVIHGLGWFCISGSLKNIKVYVNKDVNVTFRKAMI